MTDTSKKCTPVRLTDEEMQKQRQIMERIAEKNEVFCHVKGRERLYNLQTFGCQQNEADSEKLRGMLNQMGFQPTDDDEKADIILFNTCAVRDNAEQKVFGTLGALKALKKRKPEIIIGLCGCMMQQEHAVNAIKTKYRHVTMVFGTHAIYRFPEILEMAMNEKHTVIDILDSSGYIMEDLPVSREDDFRAWVPVMYGCDNFCSYCVVPKVRGRERSRHPEDVLKEIWDLSSRGYKEVTLLGQNVNSYGKNSTFNRDFADLLTDVNNITGIKRIRFMTSHPRDISEKLIYAMRDGENICPHLHLPIQSGSNEILKKMNRHYTREHYLEIIELAKREIPGIALTSDIIVGFPGETDEDFEMTLDIIRQVRFDSLFTFIYSPRHDTPAAKMEDPYTREDKQRHFEKLLEVQNEISKSINQTYLGRTVEVLVEGTSKTNAETLTGRTATNKIVNFAGDASLTGTFVNVRINNIQTWSLYGDIV